MPKNKQENVITITNDGYYSFPTHDGYTYEYQLNIKLTATDMVDIRDINKEFFEDEITNSTLGRILLRRGIKTFKNLK